MATLYPSGYSTTMVTLSQLKARHLNNMHPVYAERLFPFLESQGGALGIGGGFRVTQPIKPGFAPPGKSFHEAQRFASGILAYCAVDLVHVNPGKVHRSPTWSEVPEQGTTWAQRVRLHCNVSRTATSSGEPWHMQPIEIDGYDSWVAAGRPDPKGDPPVEPIPNPPEDDDVAKLLLRAPDGTLYITDRASYAHVVVNEPAEPEHLRDRVGASCRPDGSPWPCDRLEATFLARIAS